MLSLPTFSAPMRFDSVQSRSPRSATLAKSRQIYTLLLCPGLCCFTTFSPLPVTAHGLGASRRPARCAARRCEIAGSGGGLTSSRPVSPTSIRPLSGDPRSRSCDSSCERARPPSVSSPVRHSCVRPWDGTRRVRSVPTRLRDIPSLSVLRFCLPFARGREALRDSGHAICLRSVLLLRILCSSTTARTTRLHPPLLSPPLFPPPPPLPSPPPPHFSPRPRRDFYAVAAQRREAAGCDVVGAAAAPPARS